MALPRVQAAAAEDAARARALEAKASEVEAEHEQELRRLSRQHAQELETLREQHGREVSSFKRQAIDEQVQLHEQIGTLSEQAREAVADAARVRAAYLHIKVNRVGDLCLRWPLLGQELLEEVKHGHRRRARGRSQL